MTPAKWLIDDHKQLLTLIIEGCRHWTRVRSSIAASFTSYTAKLLLLPFLAGASFTSNEANAQTQFGNYCQQFPGIKNYLDANITDYVSILNSGDEERFCVEREGDGLLVGHTNFRSMYGDMPIVTIENSSKRYERINIYLTGGPSLEAAGALRDPIERGLIKKDVKKGGVWIFPSFYSAKGRSLYPASDLYYSVKELHQYVLFLKKKHPGVKLRIIGTSLGGYIAAMLRQELPELTVFLISPLMTNLHEFELNRMRSVATLKPQVIRHSMRIYEIPGRRNIIGFKDVGEFDYFRAFRGDTGKQNLAEMLKTNGGRCVQIVYGSRDDRIGVNEAKNIAHLAPYSRQFKVDGKGHYFNNEKDLNYVYYLLAGQVCT